MSDLRVFHRVFLTFAIALLAACEKPGADPVGRGLDAGEKPDAEDLPNGQLVREEFPDFDMAGALTALAEISDARARKRLAEKITLQIPTSELADWAIHLTALPYSDVRDALAREVLGALAAVDPRQALSLSMAFEPEESAKTLATYVAGVWAWTDHRALLDFTEGLATDSLRDEIRRIAIRSWCDRNLDEAFGHLAGLSYDDGGRFIGIAARRIGVRDGEEAIAALDLVQDPRVWDAAASGIFRAFAEEDPKGAEEWFLNQTERKVRIPIAYSLGGAFAGRSPTEAVELLNKLEDDVVAHFFLHGMIHQLNKGDMEDLLRNIPRIANPDYQASTALSTSRDLSRSNRERNLAWIATLQDENTRAHAYQGTGMGFAEGDEQAAQAWLTSLPPGKDRRYAIFGFASEYAGRDPATSAAWAMTIAEPDVRERLVRIVLSSWNSRDAEAARAWAESTGYHKLLPGNGR